MTDLIQPTELEVLKARATKLGISFHPSIGVDALRSKLAAELSEGDEYVAPVVAAAVVGDELTFRAAEVETKAQIRERLIREATCLVRVNVSCMNPNMSEHEGAIYSVSNSVIGTVKKFVKFNTEDGYHVPAIIAEHMRNRKCQIFYKARDRKGRPVTNSRMINELNVVVMPPLTEEELNDLAQSQLARHSIERETEAVY